MNYLIKNIFGHESVCCVEHFSLTQKMKQAMIIGETDDACHDCQTQYSHRRNREIDSQTNMRLIKSDDVVYLSGKMTGLPDFGRGLFHHWEGIFKYVCSCEVLSPAKLPADQEYEWYMEKCTQMVLDCTVVAMLPNWKESNGARYERHVARMIGRSIFYIK